MASERSSRSFSPVQLSRRGVVWTVLLTVVTTPQNATAQRNADATARASVFGEVVLSLNAAEVCRQAQALSDDQKFQRLAEWVFPGEGHVRLRLNGEFVAVAINAAEQAGRNPGARIQSPVLLLVDLAAELGRLEELRQRVAASTPPDAHTERCQLAMTFLIGLAAEEYTVARDSLGRLYDALATSTHYRVEDRWPETLAVTRGLASPQTHQLAAELLDAMTMRLTGNVNEWQTNSTPEWDVHVLALDGLRQQMDRDARSADSRTRQDVLRNWNPVSRQSARSIGVGLSQAQWWRRGSEVRHGPGHWCDYLWFRSPLVGNYELECEASTYPGRETQLMAAGRWVGLISDRRQYFAGTFQTTFATETLTEPLARLGLWSRMRVVVRDGTCTTSVNGRKLSEDAVAEDDPPWVALRTLMKSHGVFRDVRITGTPAIPDRINLLRDVGLSAWTDWYSESVRPGGSWQNKDGELVGTRRDRLSETACESLINYCRPMLEDGEIEFDFWYQTGRVGVSPAIGRTVFLIEPDGVRLHRVTSGRFDRSGLQPGNRSEVISGSKLPLIEGDWNRLRLELRGDVVTVAVNGQEVCQHALAISEQRSFGLFHFADETEARVRNVVWRGDWPKELPPVAEQELAAPEPEYLDGLDDLKELVAFDFSQGVPTDDFDLVGTINVEPLPQGLWLSPPERTAWSSGRFTWKEQIYGDFDIALKVSDIKQKYGEKGTLLVELAVVDDAATVVGCVRSRGAKDKVNLVAKKSIKNPNGTRQYSGARVEDELEEGTLRIVRRGAEIHSLASHGDSPNFRHVGSNRLPSSVSPVSLQMVVASTGGGRTAVVVHDLTIRSNSKAVEQSLDPNVLALDQYVSQFRRRSLHDFTKDGLTGFTVAGGDSLKSGSQGLVIRPRGGVSGDSVSLTLDALVSGEFDLSASLQLQNLPVTDNGEAAAELSLAMSGERQENVDLVVFRKSEESFRVEARSRNGEGGPASEPGYSVIASADATSVEQLRVIRIQRSLLFVFSEGGVGRLLGQASCGEGDLPAGAVSLRTRLPAGEEPAGDVRWLQFSVSSSGR